jgi:ADP-ribose pyrophosphatase YjhB (NUDIX family)
MRPGYGVRHPSIERLIATRERLVGQRVTWPNELELELSVYAGDHEGIADDLIRSVRCITRVGDGIVYCTTPHDSHIVPGGRREPGETLAETACREVREETGWIVDPESLVQLGLFHIEFLNPEKTDPVLPSPDIVQIIFTGTAVDRDCGVDEVWKDTEGWEQESRVVPLAEIDALDLSEDQQIFVEMIRQRS